MIDGFGTRTFIYLFFNSLLFLSWKNLNLSLINNSARRAAGDDLLTDLKLI